jgi:2-polyprenyl-6-methoxyphenol hydroxylase-like FAD-dependent oxidoreductase
MTTVLGARYRDVVTPRPWTGSQHGGVVLIGDAAHAMSPQLGMGASLGLADAWWLAQALRAEPRNVAAALAAYAADRRAHVRWYTWLSRIMTPVFQSDLVPVGWARDLAFGPVGRLPWVRRQFADIELGRQTSPWTSWTSDQRALVDGPYT